LVGLFLIGQVPTGEKDPFALRRHALGVVRLLIEGQLPFTLSQLVDAAANGFDSANTVEARNQLHNQTLVPFILDRLRTYLKDQGYAASHIEAVLAIQSDDVLDVVARLQALQGFANTVAAPILAAANKRIGNILRKNADQVPASGVVQFDLLHEAAEQTLWQKISAITAQVTTAVNQRDYATALQALATCHTAVDAFFADTMVMADDMVVRGNRLLLIQQLHHLMNQIADLSQLVV
jgi:glycyl-tRNA synthetase beta chain